MILCLIWGTCTPFPTGTAPLCIPTSSERTRVPVSPQLHPQLFSVSVFWGIVVTQMCVHYCFLPSIADLSFWTPFQLTLVLFFSIFGLLPPLLNFPPFCLSGLHSGFFSADSVSCLHFPSSISSVFLSPSIEYLTLDFSLPSLNHVFCFVYIVRIVILTSVSNYSRTRSSYGSLFLLVFICSCPVYLVVFGCVLDIVFENCLQKEIED